MDWCEALHGGTAGAAAAGNGVAHAASDKDKDALKKGDAGLMVPSFDPEALERGAKALREINASPYAKKVRKSRARATSHQHIQHSVCPIPQIVSAVSEILPKTQTQLGHWRSPVYLCLN